MALYDSSMTCNVILKNVIHFIFNFVDLDPGLVGLSLVYVINLTGMFQYCVRISAEVENLVRIIYT